MKDQAIKTKIKILEKNHDIREISKIMKKIGKSKSKHQKI